MTSLKVFVVLAIAAVYMASAEEIKEKKETIMITPTGIKYAEDDGLYWPGKYDRSLPIVPAMYHVPAVQGVPYMQAPIMQAPVMPYAYTHMPISRTVVV